MRNKLSIYEMSTLGPKVEVLTSLSLWPGIAMLQLSLHRVFRTLDKAFLSVQDFRTIASYLDHRSTADCVQFYYKTQKLDEFANVRRKQQLKKRRLQSDANRSVTYMGVASSQVARGAAAAARSGLPAGELIAYSDTYQSTCNQEWRAPQGRRSTAHYMKAARQDAPCPSSRHMDMLAR